MWKVPIALFPSTLMTDDCYLFGMQWQGNHFVDMALPFGLHSAPYIFSSVADLVEWVLKKQFDVSFHLHYLDDFHTLGPPNSQTCQRNLDTCIQQFQDWGILLHPDKLEGPSTLPTALGIELDTVLAHRSGFPRPLGELPPTSASSPGH